MKTREPLLIAMAGLPGTGKTTCANLIARHLQTPVIDKDDLLELLRQSTITDKLEQGRLAYDLVLSLTSRQLANHTSVIIDTCLAHTWLRRKLADTAARHHATMLIANCVCTDTVARERIAARAANDLPHRNLDEYDRLRQTFEDFDNAPDITMNTTRNLDALPANVIATIQRYAPRRVS